MHRYVTADWHGRFDVYQEVKEFLQPDDIVYFIGDAIDRGPDSLKLAMNIYTDPQFIYLKGNHEDMLVKALTNAQGLRIIDGRYWGQEEALAIWFQKGSRSAVLHRRILIAGAQKRSAICCVIWNTQVAP